MTGEGIPYVVEVAFGLHQSGLSGNGSAVSRKIVTGANWSAAISNPFRRFGSTAEGLENTSALHLACAHIHYADRGKSSIILTDNAAHPDD
jgi:hypothetical protein